MFQRHVPACSSVFPDGMQSLAVVDTVSGLADTARRIATSPNAFPLRRRGSRDDISTRLMTGSALTTRPLYRAAYRFWFPTAMIFLINGVAFGGWAALIPRATTRLQVEEGTFGLMLLAMGIGAVLAMA